LYQRFLGGTFNKGDFALWDIVSKKSESWFLAGDTTYIKKVFQVSDTLFKILEQQPFEVATVRDSVLNEEPRKVNTFGRSDLRIYEGENTTYYVSSIDTLTYRGNRLGLIDTIYVAENGRLRTINETTFGSTYIVLKDKLYALEHRAVIGNSFFEENITNVKIELFEISITQKREIQVNFDVKTFGMLRTGLFGRSKEFIPINSDSLLYLSATFKKSDNYPNARAVIALNPQSSTGKIIAEGYTIKYEALTNKIFINNIDNGINNNIDVFAFKSFDVKSNLTKLYQQKLPYRLIADDVYTVKISATLQLKSPNKSVDFTKPVSFDNHLDENEQLSFYLKNEGVGRSLNISKNQLHISGRDSTSFSLNLPENLTLKPNDSVKVQLDFVPTSRGVKEAKLIFNPAIKNARTTSATADNSLEVALIGTAKDRQLISLDLPNEVFMGTTQVIALPEIASSGLPITYSISNTNVATIENYNLLIKDGGEVSITAKQNGNADFWSADSVTHTLNVLLLLSVEPVSENKAYPNPATSWVKIPFESNGFRQNTIKVADLSGRIFKLKFAIEKSELEVDISSLPAGKYFIKLSNSSYVFVKQE
jgi:hypothetical protein